ncbi:ABC transporter ATP-binding protein [Fretibacterium sp. OH1220_COT-178]|uniref:ABC transporter ATP-binding protein n=1 Tax=Fretibacterium sp. OH1220_COT-178 TaxID=2491047 RepID=UPI000F6001A1|nr:ABC transporter ATP-binding protein [Fretibacterium sp. OH1220_COT-178]RRD63844.1 ABC transporter ATP-binding protein [Fretibacterium sp. OH1220_COT-178]
MAVSLEIRDVSKIFWKDGEPVRAVDGVSIAVAPGEMVTFLGPSGCGKTTTLRMVAGFETPSAGAILIGGRDVTGVPVNRRGIGFVFQSYALFPHMSVFENVAYGLRVKRLSEPEIRRRVTEGLELVGLAGAERRLPSQLSGGEQQRVALARVLVLRPEVLLMDEPLSNLDAKLRIHMRTEIRKIQRSLDITCLYVTHDQSEALTLSDRIMVMNGGRVEQIGAPHEIYAEPQSVFVADFIGQANVLPCRVLGTENGVFSVDVFGHVASVRGARGCALSAGSEAMLVIRPEKLVPGLASGSDGITGTVAAATFLGSHMEYEVALPGGRSALSFDPFLPGKRIWSEGESVTLGFDSAAAVLLP